MEKWKLRQGRENEIGIQDDKSGMMKTDEDRNVIEVLRGHLEFLESNGNASEVLGDAWSSGVWLV